MNNQEMSYISDIEASESSQMSPIPNVEIVCPLSKCKKCLIEKNASEFYPCKVNKMGIMGKCRACVLGEFKMRNAQLSAAIKKIKPEVKKVRLSNEINETVTELKQREKQLIIEAKEKIREDHFKEKKAFIELNL